MDCNQIGSVRVTHSAVQPTNLGNMHLGPNRLIHLALPTEYTYLLRMPAANPQMA